MTLYRLVPVRIMVSVSRRSGSERPEKRNEHGLVYSRNSSSATLEALDAASRVYAYQLGESYVSGTERSNAAKRELKQAYGVGVSSTIGPSADAYK